MSPPLGLSSLSRARLARPPFNIGRPTSPRPALFSVELSLAARPELLRLWAQVEVLHCRWAMLAIIGLIVAPAPLPPHPSLLLHPAVGPSPFASATLGLVALISAAELARAFALAGETGKTGGTGSAGEARVYPGGPLLDPLGLARRHAGALAAPPLGLGLGVFAPWLGGWLGWLGGGWWLARPVAERSDGAVKRMKGWEIMNGRLAMLATVGVFAASLTTGSGPIDNLRSHLAHPAETNVVSAVAQRAVTAPLPGAECAPCAWPQAVCQRLLGPECEAQLVGRPGSTLDPPDQESTFAPGDDAAAAAAEFAGAGLTQSESSWV